MSYNGRESARINGKEVPLGQYVEDADYVIFKENGTIKAKDGSDGSIAFSGTDASTVIQSAIDALTGGGAVYVKQPPTPYRTTDWIDIDKNNVSLVFQERFAEDGTPIVKVADGANVGGIRIGVNAHCEHVTIVGYGHHGNKDNQDQAVKRLHGILVEDASWVTIKNCYLSWTSPYHEHNSGGSGVTVRQEARNVFIHRVSTYEIGDRSIEVAGEQIRITNIYSENGFDRTVSLNVIEPDDTSYPATCVTVANVIGDTNDAGSIIGTVDGGDFTITNVVGMGDHRRLVIINGSDRVSLSNLSGYSGKRKGLLITGNNISVSNFTLKAYWEGGLQVGAPSSKVTISNGVFYNCGHAGEYHGIEIVSGNVRVNGVTVEEGAGANGVRIAANDCQVVNCRIAEINNTDAGYDGIRIVSGGYKNLVIRGNTFKNKTRVPRYQIASQDSANEATVKNNHFIDAGSSGYIGMQASELVVQQNYPKISPEIDNRDLRV